MKLTKISAHITALLILSSLILSPVFAKPENAANRGKSEKNTVSPAQTMPGSAKSCDAKFEATQKRMKQLVSLTENMTSKFTAIKDRLLGKYQKDSSKIKGYDALVSDINTKKDNIAKLLENIKTDIDNFDCKKGDIKTLTSEFRKDMQSTKKALHEYRNSIKLLISAARDSITENKTNN